MPSRVQHSYVTLPDYKKSFALLSNADQQDVKVAVVFIHGFNGSAKGTWSDFLSLVDDPNVASSWWEGADLFFFDYQWNSVFQQLTNNTLRIYKFIDQIYPAPNIIGRAHAYRHEMFLYKELVIVAHSEGGLITRKVIVEAAQRDKSIDLFIRASRYAIQPEPPAVGMLQAQLRLFAPALGGDMQTGFIGILTTMPIISNALSSSAAKKGMSPESASVTQAREQTGRYADNLMFDCFRAQIMWAEKDLIVSNEKYKDDQHCWNFPAESTHTSVCKPTVIYSLPLDFVEEGVNRHECK